MGISHENHENQNSQTKRNTCQLSTSLGQISSGLNQEKRCSTNWPLYNCFFLWISRLRMAFPKWILRNSMFYDFRGANMPRWRVEPPKKNVVRISTMGFKENKQNIPCHYVTTLYMKPARLKFNKKQWKKKEKHMGVSKNRGTPKSWILIGFSIINHPFSGTPIFGNTHIFQSACFMILLFGGVKKPKESHCFHWVSIGGVFITAIKQPKEVGAALQLSSWCIGPVQEISQESWVESVWGMIVNRNLTLLYIDNNLEVMILIMKTQM